MLGTSIGNINSERTPFEQVPLNNQIMPNGKAVPCKFPGFQSVTVIDSATYDAQFADNCWVDPAKKDLILPNCSRPVRKRSLVPSLFPKKLSFYQDRLGTNVGKSTQKRLPFSQVIALNCSGCQIDGLTVIGATGGTKDAVSLSGASQTFLTVCIYFVPSLAWQIVCLVTLKHMAPQQKPGVFYVR